MVTYQLQFSDSLLITMLKVKDSFCQSFKQIGHSKVDNETQKLNFCGHSCHFSWAIECIH